MSQRPGISKIFIDGGSHVGEGFQHFRQVYALAEYDFILVEPNPDCFKVILNKFSGLNGVKFENKAIYINNETAEFYANDAKFTHDVCETDGFSVGCSLIKSHNNLYYDAKSKYTVQCTDILDIINVWCNSYHDIILKLDIEGAEYDVLERLLANNESLQKVRKIIVEFHSQYTSDASIKERELAIKQRLSSCGIEVQIWH